MRDLYECILREDMRLIVFAGVFFYGNDARLQNRNTGKGGVIAMVGKKILEKYRRSDLSNITHIVEC